MEQESPQELLGGYGHQPLLALVRVVLPSERNFPIGKVHDPVIGDGDSMSIAGQILKHMFWPAERPLRVDHPVMTKQLAQESMENFLSGKTLCAAGEEKFAVPESSLQTGDELAAKHAAKHLHRQEERIAWMNPLAVIERQAAGRNHAVDVRMNQSSSTIP